MRQIITGQEAIFGPWLMERLGSHWFPGRGSIIGVWDTKPIAAILYEGYNGASVHLHCAGENRKWITKELLWFAFYYPFRQLKVKKIISPIEVDNKDSRRFTEHMGFILEATLKDAAPKGDLLIYTMTEDQCKWLTLKERNRVKT